MTTAGYGKRHARSTPRPLQSSAPVPVDAPGLQFFFAHRLQHPVLQQRLRQHLLEFTVLAFQFLQPPSIVDFELPELLLPAMKAHLREVVFPTDFKDRFARVRLPQDANLLFGRIPFAFHSGSFLLAPD